LSTLEYLYREGYETKYIAKVLGVNPSTVLYKCKSLTPPDLITCYKKLLSGERSQFPAGTWSSSDATLNFKKCLRYVVIESLEMSRDSFVEAIDKNFLSKYKLFAAASVMFGGNSYLAADCAFPEWKINAWELKRAGSNFWDNVTAIEATRWLYLEKLGCKTREDILEVAGYQPFEDHGIQRLFKTELGAKGVYGVMCASFPEFEFNLLNFKGARKWTVEDRRNALRYLFEEQLGLTHQDLMELDREVFTELGLDRLISHNFYSVSKILEFTYPAGDWRELYGKNGERNSQSKLTLEQVKLILISSENLDILAERYSVHRSTIWSIKNKQAWSFVKV
jgi:hypothetical protein